MFVLIYKNERRLYYILGVWVYLKTILNLLVGKWKLKIKIRICELKVKAKMHELPECIPDHLHLIIQ